MQGNMWTFCRSFEGMFLSVKTFCLVFLISLFVPLHAAPPAGLKFRGSEQPIDQRTSYNVFGDETAAFSQHFEIGFDLSLYPASQFGYILRVKNKDSNRIYNLFYDGQGEKLTFKLNEEGKSNLIVANMDKEELLNMHWFKMKISFDLQRDSIKLTINNQTFAAGNEELPDTYEPIILFGRSDHIIDVPSFALANLSIGNREKYTFSLNESKGNVVHDIRGKAYGTVINPEWLVNDAYHWRHKASFRSEQVAGANYNPVKKEIYYFNSDSLYIYNVISGETSIKIFQEKCPVELVLGTNFLDTKQHKLYSYEAYNEDYDGPTVASLDLNTYKWTAESAGQLPSPMHHHTSYLNSSNATFTLFGGFGRMHYSKDFFSYELNTKEWKAVEGFTGDFLSPRYFSSMGYLKENNSIYIFGGIQKRVPGSKACRKMNR